ncbi:MAG: porin family protein [Treponema sp.]|nr:porin family protein [Treponema sp.]
MKQKGLKLAAALFFAAACMGTSAFAEMPPIYAGVEVGYGFSNFEVGGEGNLVFSGFELTPIVGMYPLGTRNFAVELNVQMAFQKEVDDGILEYTTITPQIVAVYNFTSIPFVQPYIGAGIGYNINSIDSEVGTDMENSFSFVVKGGVRYNIPGTTCLVFGYGKYNVNSAKVEETYNGEKWEETVSAGTFSLGLGFGYMF